MYSRNNNLSHALLRTSATKEAKANSDHDTQSAKLGNQAQTVLADRSIKACSLLLVVGQRLVSLLVDGNIRYDGHTNRQILALLMQILDWLGRSFREAY